MDVPQAIFLGVLQGLTEFLPVSSSGHLVIAQSFIKDFSQPGVLFDAALHGGTLFAVLWYFRRQILKPEGKMWRLLLLGTLPAVFVGAVFKDFIEGLFLSPTAVGAALLATGAMNWMVDKEQRTAHSAEDKEIGWQNALWIGVFQAVAIIPGISRSGSTIFAGVWRGIEKKEAATFSFLLSIPAIVGAVGLQALSHSREISIDIGVYTAGMLSAAVVGYLSIDILMRTLLSRKFKIFAVYCLIVGTGVILLTLKQ